MCEGVDIVIVSRSSWLGEFALYFTPTHRDAYEPYQQWLRNDDALMMSRLVTSHRNGPDDGARHGLGCAVNQLSTSKDEESP